MDTGNLQMHSGELHMHVSGVRSFVRSSRSGRSKQQSRTTGLFQFVRLWKMLFRLESTLSCHPYAELPYLLVLLFILSDPQCSPISERSKLSLSQARHSQQVSSHQSSFVNRSVEYANRLGCGSPFTRQRQNPRSEDHNNRCTRELYKHVFHNHTLNSYKLRKVSNLQLVLYSPVPQTQNSARTPPRTFLLLLTTNTPRS